MHTDYFTVAVGAARTQAGQTTAMETHWNTYDAPTYHGTQLTACGSYVSLRRFSAEPTCGACRQQQAIYDAQQF
jgi:hypothetical protein